MKIGFIGPGVMGQSMIRNLGKAGYEVQYYARNRQKVQFLEEEGYEYVSSIRELVRNSEVVLSIVGYPRDVEEVYLSDQGILAHAKPGTVVLDMTTSSPKLAKTIYERAKAKGIDALDAPVTGGDIGAKLGTLTIFVGGDEQTYQKAKPILEKMGKTIAHVGGPGMGQHAKLANQIAIAGSIAGMAETIAYAKDQGLDVEQLIPVWASGSAGSWQLANMAPRAIKGDLEPGFFIKHFIKDLRLAKEEALVKGKSLEMLNTVIDMFEELAKKGYQDKGTQAIIDYYK